MKAIHIILLFSCLLGLEVLTVTLESHAQQSANSSDAGAKRGDGSSSAQNESPSAQQYSGTYTFLKEGEFVQVTVEDEGHVTGFISRFGDSENDKGAFLDQFFKTGKLEGDKLSFTTDTVHGVTFDFKGRVGRGEGKDPSDEAYFVLQGTLTETRTDANKKVTSESREVIFKLFPREVSPTTPDRK